MAAGEVQDKEQTGYDWSVSPVNEHGAKINFFNRLQLISLIRLLLNHMSSPFLSKVPQNIYGLSRDINLILRGSQESMLLSLKKIKLYYTSCCVCTSMHTKMEWKKTAPTLMWTSWSSMMKILGTLPPFWNSVTLQKTSWHSLWVIWSQAWSRKPHPSISSFSQKLKGVACRTISDPVLA